MQVFGNKLPFADGGIPPVEPKNLVHAVVLPHRMVRIHFPLEYPKRCSAGGDAKAGLACLKRGFTGLASGDVEVDTEDAVASNVCERAEPPFGAIRHMEPKFVLVGFAMFCQPILFAIAGL